MHAAPLFGLSRPRRHLTVAVTFLIVALHSRDHLAQAGLFSFVEDIGKGIVDTAKGIGQGIGGVLGAPFGGFVDSATSPTIRNIEDSGHRIVADVDSRMGQRIKEVDQVLANRIDDAVQKSDTMLQARIAQLGGIAEKSLAEIDRISEERLHELDLVAEQRINQVDARMKDRINDVDNVLKSRIDQVDMVLADSIANADKVLKENIDKIDQISETRIGNIDVVATRASISFEEALNRAIIVGCITVFMSFLAWRLFVATRAFKPTTDNLSALRWFGEYAKRYAPRLTVEGVGGLAGIALIYVLFINIPGGPRSRQQAVLNTHAAAFKQSLRALDFRRAIFHAEQCQWLAADDADSRKYRGRTLKAELLRDALSRPALLKTADGIASIAQRLTQIRSFLDNDPDLRIVEAMVMWTCGTSKEYEYEAARQCAIAIESYEKLPADSQDVVVLLPLAENYLASYLHSPLPDDLEKPLHESRFGGDGNAKLASDTDTQFRSHAQLRAALTSVEAQVKAYDQGRQAALRSLEHIRAYNRLVVDLDSAVVPAYLLMLASHGTYLAELEKAGNVDQAIDVAPGSLVDAVIAKEPKEPSIRKAKLERYSAALKIVSAWQHFNEQMRRNVWINGTSVPLCLFQLNDAMCSRAGWFVLNPNAVSLAPNFTGKSEADFAGAFARVPVPAATPSADPMKQPFKNTGPQDEMKRKILLKTLPPRIAWRQSLSSILSPGTWVIVDAEESRRFSDFEDVLTRFETPFVNFKKQIAKGQGGEVYAKDARLAILVAAELGWYEPSNSGEMRPYSLTLNDEYMKELGDSGRKQFAGIDEQVKLEKNVQQFLRVRRLRLL